MKKQPLRIGTRGSDLALWQANTVRDRLISVHNLAESDVEIVIIRTTGDKIQDRALLEAGGKGLFTKEIEEGLLERSIHIAVHSAKDMPTVLPDGLILAAYLEREDVRDAFIGGSAATLAELPEGAKIGTASLRRQALLKRIRPDIEITLLRGNVPTRIRKIRDGACDGTLLANAGLKRLQLTDEISSLLPEDQFPPACGQGAVVIECREDDNDVRTLLSGIADRDTGLAVTAERAFLEKLDGSCRAPIAGHATISGDQLTLYGIVLSPDGTVSFEQRVSGPIDDAIALGIDAAQSIINEAPKSFLDDLGLG